MARAEVKVTMSTEQFNLMMSVLEVELNDLTEETKGLSHPLSEDERKTGQRLLELEALIRQLR